VKLFALDDDCGILELIGHCGCEPNESYFNF
jgi:hypothetical protein